MADSQASAAAARNGIGYYYLYNIRFEMFCDLRMCYIHNVMWPVPIELGREDLADQQSSKIIF